MVNKLLLPSTSIRISQLSWQRQLTSICALLFFLLSLILPSGYSYSPFVLLLLSASFLLKKTPYDSSLITPHHRLIIYGFLIMGAVGALDVLLHNNSTRELDKSLRFILAAPIFIYLIHFPPKISFVWMGAIFGAIATGIFAIALKLVINGVGNHPNLPFYAVLIQGIPRQARIQEADIQTVEALNQGAYDAQTVSIGQDESAMIPDLDKVEATLLTQL